MKTYLYKSAAPAQVRYAIHDIIFVPTLHYIVYSNNMNVAVIPMNCRESNVCMGELNKVYKV